MGILACAIASIACAEQPMGGRASDEGRRLVLTPEQANGKSIYMEGRSLSGEEIAALLGAPPTRVSATVLPCVNCHGPDGRGKPEGGVYPSDLRWDSLARSYGNRHPTGRKHRPYDEASFARAVREGVDPSRNRLGAAMYRYEIGDRDLSDLIAYLRVLDRDVDPGVLADEIRIATVLPVDGRWAPAGRSLRKLLEGLLGEINERGGIFHRRIALEVVPAGLDPEQALRDLDRLLERSPAFAIVSPFLPEGLTGLTDLADLRRIPVIAPIGPGAERAGGESRFVFHLTPGPAMQARALVDHARRDAEPGRLRALLYAPDRDRDRGLADAVAARSAEKGVELAARVLYAADTFPTAADLAGLREGDRVFFLGEARECAALLESARALGREPSRVYLLGSRLDGSIFSAPRGGPAIFAAFPNSRSAQSARAVEEFQALLGRHDLAGDRSSLLIAGYCGVRLLLEGLEQSGRDLRRESLLFHLEGLYRFETGLMAPLTFGRNRRVGACGAYVVEVDREHRALICDGDWIEVIR